MPKTMLVAPENEVALISAKGLVILWNANAKTAKQNTAIIISFP